MYNRSTIVYIIQKHIFDGRNRFEATRSDFYLSGDAQTLIAGVVRQMATNHCRTPV